MSADIRPIASKDIPALLPLIEQYWIFEDVAGFDSARVTKQEYAVVFPDYFFGQMIICVQRKSAIGRPSGSLTVASDAAANSCLCVALRFDTFTTGGASMGAFTVKPLDQLPHNMPSLARTHRVSAPEPD